MLLSSQVNESTPEGLHPNFLGDRHCSNAFKHLAQKEGIGYAGWGEKRFKLGVKLDFKQMSIKGWQALQKEAEEFCEINRPAQYCTDPIVKKRYNEGVGCNLLRPLKKYIHFKKEQEHSRKETHPMEVRKPKKGIGRNTNTDQENVQGNKLSLANNSIITSSQLKLADPEKFFVRWGKDEWYTASWEALDDEGRKLHSKNVIKIRFHEDRTYCYFTESQVKTCVKLTKPSIGVDNGRKRVNDEESAEESEEENDEGSDEDGDEGSDEGSDEDTDEEDMEEVPQLLLVRENLVALSKQYKLRRRNKYPSCLNYLYSITVGGNRTDLINETSLKRVSKYLRELNKGTEASATAAVVLSVDGDTEEEANAKDDAVVNDDGGIEEKGFGEDGPNKENNITEDENVATTGANDDGLLYGASDHASQSEEDANNQDGENDIHDIDGDVASDTGGGFGVDDFGSHDLGYGNDTNTRLLEREVSSLGGNQNDGYSSDGCDGGAGAFGDINNEEKQQQQQEESNMDVRERESNVYGSDASDGATDDDGSTKMSKGTNGGGQKLSTCSSPRSSTSPTASSRNRIRNEKSEGEIASEGEESGGSESDSEDGSDVDSDGGSDVSGSSIQTPRQLGSLETFNFTPTPGPTPAPSPPTPAPPTTHHRTIVPREILLDEDTGSDDGSDSSVFVGTPLYIPSPNAFYFSNVANEWNQDGGHFKPKSYMQRNAWDTKNLAMPSVRRHLAGKYKQEKQKTKACKYCGTSKATLGTRNLHISHIGKRLSDRMCEKQYATLKEYKKSGLDYEDDETFPKQAADQLATLIIGMHKIGTIITTVSCNKCNPLFENIDTKDFRMLEKNHVSPRDIHVMLKTRARKKRRAGRRR